MSIELNVNNSVKTTSLSAKERVQHNWNNHKVKVISSGVSTVGLAGGIVAASILGGPIGLIIGLAAAALLALGAFLLSILAQPKNVKPLELPTEKSVEMTETAVVAAEHAVTAETQVESPVVQEKQPETAPVEKQEEEKQTEPSPVVSEAVVKETPKTSRLSAAASFVKAHKLALGLGAAAIATGVAGYGIYTYAPAISAFAADAALKASEVASATAETVSSAASQVKDSAVNFASAASAKAYSFLPNIFATSVA